MKSSPKKSTKATLGAGLSFAVAGSSLFTLTPAIANGATACTDEPEEISSGVFEVVCDTVGSGTWTPPENVTALEALLVAGGSGGYKYGTDESYGAGGQVTLMTNLTAASGEITFSVGAGGSNVTGPEESIGGNTKIRQGTVEGFALGGKTFDDDSTITTRSYEAGVNFASIDDADDNFFESDAPYGAGTQGADGSGVTPSTFASSNGGNAELWPELDDEIVYGLGGFSTGSIFPGGGAMAVNGDGEDGVVVFRYTVGSSAPTPYSGPIVTDVGEDGIAAPFSTFGGQTVRVDGERLSTVSKVFVDGKEGEVISTADDHFVMTVPDGISEGSYDLVINSSLGNLTYLGAFTVSESGAENAAANAVCEGVEPSWWTQRISDTQAKAYIKCPEVGQKYRILQQTGGSGDYDSVFVKTLTDENDSTQVFNEFGRYIVRTIDLEDINRLRITVDDEELWKVRYNNPPVGAVSY